MAVIQLVSQEVRQVAHLAQHHLLGDACPADPSASVAAAEATCQASSVVHLVLAVGPVEASCQGVVQPALAEPSAFQVVVEG